MKKTYAEKLAAALAALRAYNSNVPPDAQISPEGFEQNLRTKIGAFDEATLALVTVEDLTENSIPNALARRLVQVFRDQDAASGGTSIRRITPNNAGDANIEDLVAAYDPKRSTTPAAEELRKRTQGQPCIAFRSDGTVDRETTVREVSAVANGEPPREHAIVEGRPAKLYPVGTMPPQTADEHPLKRGESLRKDGTDPLGLDWGGIALNIRQLLRLAVESRELSISGPDDTHDIYERASAQNAFETLRRRYVQASTRFDELEGLGQLPTLKIQRGGTPHVQDPFAGGHRRF